jgi:hypothetical protein
MATPALGRPSALCGRQLYGVELPNRVANVVDVIFFRVWDCSRARFLIQLDPWRCVESLIFLPQLRRATPGRMANVGV